MRTAPPHTSEASFPLLLSRNNSLSVLVKQSYVWPIFFSAQAGKQSTWLSSTWERLFETARCNFLTDEPLSSPHPLKIGFTSVATWQPGRPPVAGGAEWVTVWAGGKGSLSSFFYVNNTDLRRVFGRKEEKMQEREQKKGWRVQEAGVSALGRRILKMKGGAGKETWTGGSSSSSGGGTQAEIAEKWGTLDKMRNGMANG